MLEERLFFFKWKWWYWKLVN